jgi:hypothetical protein
VAGLDGLGPYTDIAGATSTTYSFTTAPADTGKSYHAVFTNTAGSATSNAATLTVNSVAQDVDRVEGRHRAPGTVTSSPAGIACGRDVRRELCLWHQRDAHATPATGSSFAGWSGSGVHGNRTCVVAMSAARSVSAQFTRQTGSLSVTLGRPAGGTS